MAFLVSSPLPFLSHVSSTAANYIAKSSVKNQSVFNHTILSTCPRMKNHIHRHISNEHFPKFWFAFKLNFKLTVIHIFSLFTTTYQHRINLILFRYSLGIVSLLSYFAAFSSLVYYLSIRTIKI